MNDRTLFEKAVHDNAFRTLISKEELATRIRELGLEITKDYRGKDPIMIGVLNGSFVFISDLLRAVELDL